MQFELFPFNFYSLIYVFSSFLLVLYTLPCFTFLASRYFICLFVYLLFVVKLSALHTLFCLHMHAMHKLMMCDVQRFAIFEMILTHLNAYT